MRRPSLAALAAASLLTASGAVFLGGGVAHGESRALAAVIAIDDVPNTDGHWQEARGVVEAPPQVVRAWLLDYRHWTEWFSDVERVDLLSQEGHTATLRFQSRIFERAIVIHVYPTTDGGIAFQGQDGPIRTEGRVYLSDAGDGRTAVRIQNMAHIGGVIGAFIPGGMIKDRQRRKLRADLSDLMRYAHRWAMRPPAGGLDRTLVNGRQ